MALKRFMFAAFVAFVSSVATIGILGRLSPSPVAPPVAAERRVGRDELARHSGARDCWMAIGGQAYDLTSYLPRHPAPPSVMTRWCGRDATEAFATKGRGRPHSPAARVMLAQYRIGLFTP